MTDHPDEASRIARRLRAALEHRASTVEPGPDGLDRIEEALMSDPSRSARPWAIAALGVAAAAVLVVVGVAVASNDDDADVAADTTSTIGEETTTSVAPTTVFAPTVDPRSVAFPDPSGSRRFQSAETVGRAYATDVLGFTDLVVGEFREGDSRSGELPVSDRDDGPETLILLRQMDDDTWFAIGSQTGDIVLDAPESRAELTSPFSTTGEALAFEGTVDVVVLASTDLSAPIGEGFVTGSGTPPAGPFEGEISFTAPAEDTPGIIVFRTRSAEDGHVEQATSIPVTLLAG